MYFMMSLYFDLWYNTEWRLYIIPRGDMDEGTITKTKEMLDDMHKRKIDMADEIFVINVGGYIGDSTRSEIQYAKDHNKKVNYLEPVE